MGIQFGTEFQGGNMKIFLAVLVLLPLALSFPAGDQPFLNIKVSGPGVGGSFGTSVSKQKVELEENGKVSYEPYHPHVPPFLAFKKYNPAALPPAQPAPVYQPQPVPVAKEAPAEPAEA